MEILIYKKNKFWKLYTPQNASFEISFCKKSAKTTTTTKHFRMVGVFFLLQKLWIKNWFVKCNLTTILPNPSYLRAICEPLIWYIELLILLLIVLLSIISMWKEWHQLKIRKLVKDCINKYFQPKCQLWQEIEVLL